jgi:hypothetical protein
MFKMLLNLKWYIEVKPDGQLSHGAPGRQQYRQRRFGPTSTWTRPLQ